jgi:hypothetical protein
MDEARVWTRMLESMAAYTGYGRTALWHGTSSILDTFCNPTIIMKVVFFDDSWSLH